MELQVNQANYLAEIRGFSSAREAAPLLGPRCLSPVYDNLVETVDKNLGLLHHYVSLRKKLLSLDEIHSYDLYVPVVEEVDLKYSMEKKAQDIIKRAKPPLGEDYQVILDQAFSERWLGYAVNEGAEAVWCLFWWLLRLSALYSYELAGQPE